MEDFYTRSLTEARARLQTLIDSIPPSPSDSESDLSSDQWRHKLTIHSCKLRSLIGHVDTQISKWNKHICNEISDESAKTTAKQHIREFLFGENGLNTILLNTRETIASLEATTHGLTDSSSASTHMRQPSELAHNGDSEQQPAFESTTNRVLGTTSLSRPDFTLPQDSPVPVKLPKQPLPIFDGTFTHWGPFKDAFDYAVHTQPYPNVIKFTYLKSALNGPALKVIEGIPLTDMNYPVAYETLQERFGNKEECIDKLYMELDKIDFSSNHPLDLRDSLDELTGVIRQLEAYGEQVSYNRPIINQIVRKLPTSTQIELEKVKPREETWNFHSLKKALDDMIRLFELVEGRGNAAGDKHNMSHSFSVVLQPNCCSCTNSHGPEDHEMGELSRNYSCCDGLHQDDNCCPHYDT